MKFRQQKSGSWAFFRFFSARRRCLSWVYLFQEISLYRAYGQEDTTKRIVMNLKSMLLMGLFILLKYTVSSSQRLVLSNCGYLTLTFFACQEVFYFFLIFLFGVSFGAFLLGLFFSTLASGYSSKTRYRTQSVRYSLWIEKRRFLSAFP